MASKDKQKIHWNLKDILSYFISKKFFINLGFIFLLLIILSFVVQQGLRIFTHHGDKLRMPDYINSPLSTARQDAKDRTFKIVVNDSIFIVGKPGNIILNQNPKPDSYVKKNRTIYVTVTKNLPETVTVGELPRLYGENFDIKSQELMIGYQIETEIVGSSYDPGPEGHILAVINKGDTIISSKYVKDKVILEKGQTLQFILSSRSGGMVHIPKLRCRSYSEARFLLESYSLEIIPLDGSETGSDINTAYVNYQQPMYDPEGKIRMGDTIFVRLTTEYPENCDDDDME